MTNSPQDIERKFREAAAAPLGALRKTTEGLQFIRLCLLAGIFFLGLLLMPPIIASQFHGHSTAFALNTFALYALEAIFIFGMRRLAVASRKRRFGDNISLNAAVLFDLTVGLMSCAVGIPFLGWMAALFRHTDDIAAAVCAGLAIALAVRVWWQGRRYVNSE